ncbi:hypothetical protein HDU98_009790 [Podochytrium sp. JEL0797]|nr:hypothetical protein HDU98_009790 [Podochytrium sp. JEL0797]
MRAITSLALLATAAQSALIQAGNGISYNGQASSDGQSVVFTVTAPAGTTWVALGFGSSMSTSNQLHVMWFTGSQFVLSDRTASGYNAVVNPASPNGLQLVSGTGVDAAGNWNIVFSRTMGGIGATPGQALNFMFAASTGQGLISSADPGAALGMHNLDGHLNGALIDPAPAPPPPAAVAPPAPTAAVPPPVSIQDAPVTSAVVDFSTSQAAPLSVPPAQASPTDSPPSPPPVTTTLPSVPAQVAPEFVGKPVGNSNAMLRSAASKKIGGFVTFWIFLLASLSLAQIYLPSLINPIPFDSQLNAACQASLVSSPAVISAFQMCGLLGLMAMNAPSLQLSTLQSAMLLPRLCHSNCTAALSLLREAVGDCSTTTANPYAILQSANPIVQNTVVYTMNPFLDVFGGLDFSDLVSASLVLQSLVCFHVDSAKDVALGSLALPPVPNPFLNRTEFCVARFVDKIVEVYGASAIPGLDAIGSNAQIVCPDPQLKSCMTRASRLLGEAVTEANNVYSYFSPFATALKGTLGSC